MRLPQLRRVRWAVRATLCLGVAASVTANVLHAQDNPISQAIAAWPPLALLLTVELISRVPVHRRSLAATRLAATAIIAGIAAWVSYWHMAGVASRYGETGASPYLLPLSVDGLIIVASICLVELAGRIRETEDEREAEVTGAGAPTVALAPPVVPAPAPHLAPAMSATPNGSYLGSSHLDGVAPHSAPAPRRLTGSAAHRVAPTSPASGAAVPRQRRPVAETAALAAAIEAAHPDITDAEVAQQLGISTTRLKAIKRETRQLEPAG